LFVVARAGAANAQPSAPPPAPPTEGQGPLVFEQAHSSFVLAPDVKVTDVDDETGAIVGGYGGALIHNAVLLGGGGYWLANNPGDTDMAYGGLVAGWFLRRDKPVGLSVKTLFGWGEATLHDRFTVIVPRDVRFGGGSGSSQVVRTYAYDQTFMVFEPQADVFVRFADWFRLSCGLGYRVVGATSYDVDSRLSGITGSVSFQFGSR